MRNQPVVPPEYVQLDVPAGDWREAIRRAAAPLVTGGAVTPSYVAAMERVMEEMGPYFVIVPGVALAHARPEEGALQPALALSRLSEPVNFGHEDNDPVWLVMVLAGSSDESHLGLLQQVARFLGDTAALERLRSAETPEEAAALANRSM
ncbi:MAG: PTS sugar transporter subunit IIA [Bacillota bacterium]